MGKALYIQSVEDAASVAGGYERLAATLGVGLDEVERWRTGSAIPECAVLLRVIELILDVGAKLRPAAAPAADALVEREPSPSTLG